MASPPSSLLSAKKQKSIRNALQQDQSRFPPSLGNQGFDYISIFIVFNNKMLGKRRNDNYEVTFQADQPMGDVTLRTQFKDISNYSQQRQKSPIKQIEMMEDRNYGTWWERDQRNDEENQTKNIRTPNRSEHKFEFHEDNKRKRDFNMRVNNIEKMSSKIHDLLDYVKNPNRKSVIKEIREPPKRPQPSFVSTQYKKEYINTPTRKLIHQQQNYQEDSLEVNERNKNNKFDQQENNQYSRQNFKALQKMREHQEYRREEIQEDCRQKQHKKYEYCFDSNKIGKIEGLQNKITKKRQHPKEIDDEIIKVKSIINKVQRNIENIEKDKSLKKGSDHTPQKHQYPQIKNSDNSNRRTKKNYMAMTNVPHIEEDFQKNYVIPPRSQLKLKIKPVQHQKQSYGRPLVYLQNKEETCKKIALKLSEQIQFDKKLRYAKDEFSNIIDHNKWIQLKDFLSNQGYNCSEEELERQLTINDNQCDPFQIHDRRRCNWTQALGQAFINSQNFWQNKLGSISRRELQQSGFKSQELDLDQRGYLKQEDLVCFINLYSTNFFRNRDLSCLMKRMMNLDRNRNGVSYSTFEDKICYG